LPLNATTAVRFFISAKAVTGDNAIAVITAVQPRKERPIVRPSSGTGRRKKAGKPIAGRNSGDDLKKTGSGKKTWMMKVQHQAAAMVAWSQINQKAVSTAVVAGQMAWLSTNFPAVDMAGALPAIRQPYNHPVSGVIMVRKQLLNPERVRKIEGSFSFIEHRFLRQGFWATLGHHELLLYFFLILVADRQGISYYSYDHICKATGLLLEEYLQARDGLIDKDLLAFDGFFFQILSLPEKPMPKAVEPLHSAVQTLCKQWSATRADQ